MKKLRRENGRDITELLGGMDRSGRQKGGHPFLSVLGRLGRSLARLSSHGSVMGCGKIPFFWAELGCKAPMR
jgi:hypothetical protein